MASDQQANELARLTSLVDAGFASPEEVTRHAVLMHAGALAAQPASAPSQPMAAPAQETQTISAGDVGQIDAAAMIASEELPNYVPANTDSFAGGEWKPPVNPGVYPAVCTDFTYSADDDRAMIIVENRPGEIPEFRGSLGASKINAKEKSGAWALRQALDNMSVPYRIEEGRGVAIGRITGVECQADWQYIDNRGVRELRVQGLYGKDADIQQSI